MPQHLRVRAGKLLVIFIIYSRNGEKGKRMISKPVALPQAIWKITLRIQESDRKSMCMQQRSAHDGQL